MNNTVENESSLIRPHSTTPTSPSLSFMNLAAGQIVSQAKSMQTSSFPPLSSISPPPSSSSSSGSANGFLGNAIFNGNNHFGNLITTENQSLLNSATTASRPIRSQRTPMKDITTLDDPMELEQFMSQGEEGCINDMKQFITQFSLRQTTVAMMTGYKLNLLKFNNFLTFFKSTLFKKK